MSTTPQNKLHKISLISGSKRAGSFNTALLKHINKKLQNHVEVEIIDSIDLDFPIYCEDLESDSDIQQTNARLHKILSSSHAFILASPEHNGHVSAYLKNIVDWQSRIYRTSPGTSNAFSEKWILLCCASTGRLGGNLAISYAKSLFSYLGGFVFPQSISVANSESRFASDASGLSDDLESYIQTVLDKFLRQISKVEHGQ